MSNTACTIKVERIANYIVSLDIYHGKYEVYAIYCLSESYIGNPIFLKAFAKEKSAMAYFEKIKAIVKERNNIK